MRPCGGGRHGIDDLCASSASGIAWWLQVRQRDRDRFHGSRWPGGCVHRSGHGLIDRELQHRRTSGHAGGSRRLRCAIPPASGGGDRVWSDGRGNRRDRKSTRLNSSHQIISYAVFCLKKKKKTTKFFLSKKKKKKSTKYYK